MALHLVDGRHPVFIPRTQEALERLRAVLNPRLLCQDAGVTPAGRFARIVAASVRSVRSADERWRQTVPILRRGAGFLNGRIATAIPRALPETASTTSAGVQKGHTATENAAPRARTPQTLVGRSPRNAIRGSGIRIQPGQANPRTISNGSRINHQ